jgi:hypothetical protein
MAAAGISKKSHSIIAASVGGGGPGVSSLGWDFGSSGDLGMTSVPTSPTAPSPNLQTQLSRWKRCYMGQVFIHFFPRKILWNFLETRFFKTLNLKLKNSIFSQHYFGENFLREFSP